MKKYFKELGLPCYENLLEELNGLIDWHNYSQICLNSPVGYEDNHQFGVGSLYYDWDKSEKVWNNDEGTYNWVVPKREPELSEFDFTETVTLFQGTTFEKILEMLKYNGYNLGRVRIMNLAPKTCLTWHADDSIRLHYPFKTHPGCKMIIEDEVCDLLQNKWWQTETTYKHTAINASKEARLHIVAALL